MAYLDHTTMHIGIHLLSFRHFSPVLCPGQVSGGPECGILFYGSQPVWNNCNPLSTCALFYSMETMTPVSTNLASWLRRSFCQREWVTAECTQHSPAKMFTRSLVFIDTCTSVIVPHALCYLHVLTDVCVVGDKLVPDDCRNVGGEDHSMLRRAQG